MAKLYFRYGVMGSGKSTQLLQIAHDYEVNNSKKVMVMKPRVDTKANDYVVTRMGEGVFSRQCEYLIPGKSEVFKIVEEQQPDIVLIDESQFLTRSNVWELVSVVVELDVPVICFGLKVDSNGEPFEGSTYLFALAQDIEEMQTRALSRADDNTKRATMNLRLENGLPVFNQEQIQIDNKKEVEYKPVSLPTFLKFKCEYSNE